MTYGTLGSHSSYTLFYLHVISEEQIRRIDGNRDICNEVILLRNGSSQKRICLFCSFQVPHVAYLKYGMSVEIFSEMDQNSLNCIKNLKLIDSIVFQSQSLIFGASPNPIFFISTKLRTSKNLHCMILGAKEFGLLFIPG